MIKQDLIFLIDPYTYTTEPLTEAENKAILHQLQRLGEEIKEIKEISEPDLDNR